MNRPMTNSEREVKILIDDYESKNQCNNHILETIKNLREIKETTDLKYEEHDLAISNAIDMLYSLGQIVYRFEGEE